jgi:hypothetical protein
MPGVNTPAPKGECGNFPCLANVTLIRNFIMIPTAILLSVSLREAPFIPARPVRRGSVPYSTILPLCL